MTPVWSIFPSCPVLVSYCRRCLSSLTSWYLGLSLCLNCAVYTRIDYCNQYCVKRAILRWQLSLQVHGVQRPETCNRLNIGRWRHFAPVTFTSALSNNRLSYRPTSSQSTAHFLFSAKWSHKRACVRSAPWQHSTCCEVARTTARWSSASAAYCCQGDVQTCRSIVAKNGVIELVLRALRL